MAGFMTSAPALSASAVPGGSSTFGSADHCDIDAEFAMLRSIMGSVKFRKSLNTAGEQAFYIYDYPPERQIEVDEHIERLISQLQTMTPHIDEDPDDVAPAVLRIDLYDVAINILERRKVLDKVLGIEEKRHQTMSPNPREDKFLSLLDNMLGADSEQLPNTIRDIYKKARERAAADIVFLTGVGMVYPYVRSHTLMDTLQGRIDDDCPLVLFFPGTFTQTSLTGSTLSLFGCLPASNYYRAISLRDMIAAWRPQT